jgi:uncharacterized protein (UPF0335 family)
MAELDIEKLNDFISRIEKLKEKQATLEGAKKAILDQLKDEFGVESISEASKLYRKLQGEIQVETEEIEKSIYKVEELLHDTEY